MKKLLVLALVGFIAVGFAAAATAAEYDRYERGYTSPPPPPPPEAPPRYRVAPTQPMRHAVQGETYLFGHIGVFDPNSEPDGLSGYDSGMNFDLGIGSRVSPFFAVEGTIGGYRAERGSDEATVVPLTIGGRLIIPHPFIEPYIGAGLGLYFSSLDEGPGLVSTGIDDSDTNFGGYLSIGADFWLNPRTALNFEGKYHWVTPTLSDSSGRSFDVDMSGWTVNLGVRFSF